MDDPDFVREWKFCRGLGAPPGRTARPVQPGIGVLPGDGQHRASRIAGWCGINSANSQVTAAEYNTFVQRAIMAWHDAFPDKAVVPAAGRQRRPVLQLCLGQICADANDNAGLVCRHRKYNRQTSAWDTTARRPTCRAITCRSAAGGYRGRCGSLDMVGASKHAAGQIQPAIWTRPASTAPGGCNTVLVMADGAELSHRSRGRSHAVVVHGHSGNDDCASSVSETMRRQYGFPVDFGTALRKWRDPRHGKGFGWRGRMNGHRMAMRSGIDGPFETQYLDETTNALSYHCCTRQRCEQRAQTPRYPATATLAGTAAR